MAEHHEYYKQMCALDHYPRHRPFGNYRLNVLAYIQGSVDVVDRSVAELVISIVQQEDQNQPVQETNQLGTGENQV